MAMHARLVEDGPGHIRLTHAAFLEANEEIQLHAVADGVDAMTFVRREREHTEAPVPDLILLDLNLPRMDGREILTHIKADDSRKTSPTVIPTMSEAEADSLASYRFQANVYVKKPVEWRAFEAVVNSLHDFGSTRDRPPHQPVTG